MKLLPDVPSAVQLVVTCSNSKRPSVPQELRIGNLREQGPRSPEIALSAWLERLYSSPVTSHPAMSLYKGDRWGVITELDSSYTTWICSAGYGLVPSTAPLKPYSATFSPREEDAVSRVVSAPSPEAAWWTQLGRWPGPAPSTPRSISSLAQHAECLVIMLSPPYLSACNSDLERARMILGSERMVIVTSAGARRGDAVIAERRMLPVLGGTDITLSVRLARWLLRKLGDDITTSSAATLAEELAASQPEATRPQRQQVDDVAVVSFIRRRLADDPSRSATSLLRELRSEVGLACEQKRFHALVRRTKEEAAHV